MHFACQISHGAFVLVADLLSFLTVSVAPVKLRTKLRGIKSASVAQATGEAWK